jgi:16S rRNA A1518/A1519 N6-dimethyltransferase RsmA/KsgA/DIM1 with predicted DNA glycosylase/AP lyase activity
VIGAAFAHRRKQLPNSIELAGLARAHDVAAALATIGREPSARAESLTPEEFVALTRALG